MEEVTRNNLNLAKEIALQERVGDIFQNTKTIEELAEENNKAKFNSQVENYVDKLEKHSQLLEEYKKKFIDEMEGIEIKPVFEGILIKPFEINPFQQVRAINGIYFDTGGLAPEYKSHEDGEIHEEEAYVKVGVVMEVGPDVKYIQNGDVVMWRKPSQLPIPFYKQGFVLVGEHAIVSVVNDGLTDRFNKIKENGNGR